MLFHLLHILIFLASHPIHLSKCEMEVNEDSKRMEVSLHVFIDDLQEVIQKSGSPELFLATKSEITEADSFIFQYITKHLVITNKDQTVALEWVGKEMSDDLLAFWCYLESDAIDEREEITIQFSVLHDLYDDQQNILNVVSSEGQESYYLCRKGDDTTTLE